MKKKRILKNKRAFTAVELTMVAAIIAIISLLVVPILRKRTELAKVAACRSEMKTFATVQTLAHAETGYYYRLFDLNNVAEFEPGSTNYTREVPLYDWKGTRLTDVDRAAIALVWKGPYVEYNVTAPEKFMYLEDLFDLAPYYFFSQPANQTGGNTTGGIFIDPATAVYYAEAVVPLDPWGNPYFFFGTESGQETSYHSGIIWSLGPDGIVGDRTNQIAVIENPDSYRRNQDEGGQFGQGDSDDLSHTF